MLEPFFPKGLGIIGFRVEEHKKGSRKPISTPTPRDGYRGSSDSSPWVDLQKSTSQTLFQLISDPKAKALKA